MEADGPGSPACGMAETVREAHPSNPPFPAAHPEELGRHILKLQLPPSPPDFSQGVQKNQITCPEDFSLSEQGWGCRQGPVSGSGGSSSPGLLPASVAPPREGSGSVHWVLLLQSQGGVGPVIHSSLHSFMQRNYTCEGTWHTCYVTVSRRHYHGTFFTLALRQSGDYSSLCSLDTFSLGREGAT